MGDEMQEEYPFLKMHSQLNSTYRTPSSKSVLGKDAMRDVPHRNRLQNKTSSRITEEIEMVEVEHVEPEAVLSKKAFDIDENRALCRWRKRKEGFTEFKSSKKMIMPATMEEPSGTFEAFWIPVV